MTLTNILDTIYDPDNHTRHQIQQHRYTTHQLREKSIEYTRITVSDVKIQKKPKYRQITLGLLQHTDKSHFMFYSVQLANS